MQIAAHALLALLGAAAAAAQGTTDVATLSINTEIAKTIQRYTMAPGGSTPVYISTDTSVAPPVTSSASGTILPTLNPVPSFDMSSAAAAAASSGALNRTASSNYTLPSATATATPGPGFVVQQSNPYVMQVVDPKDLPRMNFNLANETEVRRQVICGQQTKFCATAGCAEEGAKINYNFCDVDTLASRCTCDKGASNLQQWKWPVQFNDCLARASTCTDMCSIPGGTTAERTACKNACQTNFRDTCGMPGQYSANYAVAKSGDKPNLDMMQGGSAGDGAAFLRASSLAVAAAFAFAAVVLVA